MTRMTVLHIASPFAFSMPMPERNATQAAAPATGDAALVTTSADHAVTSADDATPEGESGRFDPNSREAVLRRYAAFDGPDRNSGSVEPVLDGSRAGGEPEQQDLRETAKVLDQNQPDPNRKHSDQQGRRDGRP